MVSARHEPPVRRGSPGEPIQHQAPRAEQGERARHHRKPHRERPARRSRAIGAWPPAGAGGGAGLRPAREHGDLLIGLLACRQTAEIVRAQLGALGIVIAEALRERCFGDWEGSATSNYARVWATDETNPCCADGDVEPTIAVLDRATAFIVDLERRHSGRDILLVSHGDTLQILWAGFLRMNPSQRRSLPELKTAEIRQLRLPIREPSPAPLPESGGERPV